MVAVYAPSWATLYTMTDPAATFAVTAPVPTATPTPTPAPTAAPTPTPSPSPAGIGYRAGTTNWAASGTSFTLSLPAGVQNGDLLVMSISNWPGTLIAPSGWTLASAISAYQGVWYKIAKSEPTSYTWSSSADSSWSGVADAFSGVDNASPLDVRSASSSGTALGVTWPALTSVSNNAWSLVVSLESNNTSTVGVPSGYTARSVQGGDSFIRTATKLVSPAGLVAPTATDSATAPLWSAYSLLLRPVGSTAPTPAPAPTTTPAPTPAPTPVATPAPTSSSGISPLHVQGNRLVNSLAQPVLLHGANIAGTAYMCVQNRGIFEGPSDANAIKAIKSWRTNVVRIELNEDCWLGINGLNSAYSGANYRQAIANYVSLLNANGMYAILDLHWSAPGTTLADEQRPMADADHAPAFWSSVANTFKGNNAVIFELFNEPRDISWSCWRDGGCIATDDHAGGTFTIAGMQTLVNSVRATGATNVLGLGGLDWSSDLSGWLSFKPNDPQNNMAATFHNYNFSGCSWASCWSGDPTTVAAQVPLIATEIGTNNCDATFFNSLTSWLDSHASSYTAHVWELWGSSCSSMALVTDYAGTPTQFGQMYKNHLAGLP